MMIHFQWKYFEEEDKIGRLAFKIYVERLDFYGTLFLL